MPEEVPEVMQRRVPTGGAIFPDSFEGPARPISPGYDTSRVRPPVEWFIAHSLPDYVDWRTFTPAAGVEPGKLLARWLLRLTPPGAEIVPIGAQVPPGTRDWPTAEHRPFGPPLIINVATPPLPYRRADRRIELERRMPQGDYREAGRQAPRTGIPMWAMKAAFLRDIYGYSQLQLRDHLELRDFSTEDAGDGSRSVRRYVQRGRAELAKLCAWPWCMSPGEPPSHRWWTDEKYATPLALWHYQQTLSELGAVLASIECAAGATPQIGSRSALELAERVYRDAYVGVVKRRQSYAG